MLSDADMRARMANGWRMGKPFTICGNGSLPHATENARRVLPLWCQRYGLKVVNDAGAGDMKWKHGMQWDVLYRPFDLVPRSPEVNACDITTESMPPADLIVCRMVLNHLDSVRVGMALQQFRVSAPYLAATQFDGENLPQRSPQFKRLDLREWLGPPIECEIDGTEPECRIALWKL
jgi:hypothetical protein